MKDIPAFPSVNIFNGEENNKKLGMTLRDYFAGQALAGYYATPKMIVGTKNNISKMCYEQADAMLSQKEEGK